MNVRKDINRRQNLYQLRAAKALLGWKSRKERHRGEVWGRQGRNGPNGMSFSAGKSEENLFLLQRIYAKIVRRERGRFYGGRKTSQEERLHGAAAHG